MEAIIETCKHLNHSHFFIRAYLAPFMTPGLVYSRRTCVSKACGSGLVSRLVVSSCFSSSVRRRASVAVKLRRRRAEKETMQDDAKATVPHHRDPTTVQHFNAAPLGFGVYQRLEYL